MNSPILTLFLKIEDLETFVPRSKEREETLRQLIRDYINDSSFKFFKFQDGEGNILAIWGLMETAPGVCEIWQWPGKDYSLRRKDLFRRSLDIIYGFIPKLCDKLIITINDESGDIGHKWAVKLGARPLLALPKFRYDKDHTLYIIDLSKEKV